jgi:hypothetical protein
VPVRGAPVEFCPTANVTEPMPAPVAPLLTVIQLTALTAVQEHCVPVMMLRVRWLAIESTVNVVEVSVNEHWRASEKDAPASQARTTSAPQRKILMVSSWNTGNTGWWRPFALHRAGRSCGRLKQCQFAPKSAGAAEDRAGIVSEMTTLGGFPSPCTMSGSC